ncbi:unnamed protein product [Mycena citricolor]|uniref:Uncharacterized protein n=1 Tax=Mycena citricolor TaxID=2018698 RepID=A0AAD2HZE3_9AGAR|nr:unnamed protein product [Mycena citricolor]
MRSFQSKTCSKYTTKELPREAAARARQEQRDAQAKAASGSTAPSKQTKRNKSEKGLNLATYKWHSLGDYVNFIRLFGPTDNYSTQVGESLHRVVKRLYGMTNKRNHAGQIGVRVTRMARARVSQRIREAKKMRHFHLVGFDQPDPFTMTDNHAHHATSRVQRYPLYINRFSYAITGDPALKNFVPKLQDHLLGRLLEREFDGDTHESFKAIDRQSVQIIGNRLYTTKTLRVNYTTYDVRREQDIINPRMSAFIMVRSPETQSDAHPYWYAQVLGVFHTSACISSSSLVSATRTYDFLWVRWLGIEPGRRAGFKNARLPKVGFVEESDSLAFGFLDPAYVVRGCHLIPDLSGGRTNSLLSTTKKTAARSVDETSDWASFYVNIFLDRDMVMRYFGGGIGHLSVQPETEEEDADDPDEDEDQEDEEDTPEKDNKEEDKPEEDEDDSEEEEDDSEEDEEDDEEEVEEDDFGADDGEDDHEDTGYADL